MNRFIFDTSATTGAAKQVIFSEQALLAQAEVDVAELGLTSKTVINVDRSGIGAMRKFYCAKVSGARLAFYPGHEKASMRSWVMQEKITYLSLLASTFRWLAQGLYILPTVEIIECGGEMVDWGDVSLARTVCPNAVFINRYGCSETNIICRKRVERDQPTGEGRLPVGQPVKGVGIIITEHGEIAVYSPYLSDGYYNDPELTAAKFKNGWYYTGDKGYWLPDCDVMHCGRMDFQSETSSKFTADSESTHDERVANWTLAGG